MLYSFFISLIFLIFKYLFSYPILYSIIQFPFILQSIFIQHSIIFIKNSNTLNLINVKPFSYFHLFYNLLLLIFLKLIIIWVLSLLLIRFGVWLLFIPFFIILPHIIIQAFINELFPFLLSLPMLSLIIYLFYSFIS